MRERRTRELELERLDREQLLAKAEEIGLAALGSLSRRELIDLLRLALDHPARKDAPDHRPLRSASTATAPTPGSPAPGSPAPGSPAPGSPAPGSPAPGSPAPGSPAPGSPTVGSPAPGSPAPGSPAPSFQPQRGTATAEPRPSRAPRAFALDDRLVLMVRDASTLFAYWHLDETSKRPVRDEAGVQLALRLVELDAADRARAITDHPLAEWSRDLTLPAPNADRRYRAELGYVDSVRTGWLPLLRSRPVTVPPRREDALGPAAPSETAPSAASTAARDEPQREASERGATRRARRPPPWLPQPKGPPGSDEAPSGEPTELSWSGRPLHAPFSWQQHGSPQHGSSQHGSPQHGSPQHGSPQHGSPQHGSPRHGSPQHGSPQHGSPQHGSPQHGSPQRGSPQK